MNVPAIKHQFEFWSHIGQVGGYFHQYDSFSCLSPKDATWPSKIFNLKESYITQLKTQIVSHQLTKSVAVHANERIETLLQEQGFTQTSSVEAMTMSGKITTQYTTHPEIEKVKTIFGAEKFAKISSEAFGYTIYNSSIILLIWSDSIQLFLGTYQGRYVSCGIVFKDTNGDSGLHMIGAKREYRGLGLGKKMTEHLLSIALESGSKHIHLVASKLGAPIYRKFGFQTQGYLKSYTI